MSGESLKEENIFFKGGKSILIPYPQSVSYMMSNSFIMEILTIATIPMYGKQNSTTK